MEPIGMMIQLLKNGTSDKKWHVASIDIPVTAPIYAFVCAY
jgi:hypothetical protein